MLNNLLNDYQVFLFDLDGLLVDTERLHYKAFFALLNETGFNLDWTFEDYVKAAHFSSTGLEETVQKALPALLDKVGEWKSWYAKKRPYFLACLKEGVPLMEGVAPFIEALDNHRVKMALVTHSPLALVEEIAKQQPVLKKIPYWYTRETYQKPKPDPQSFNLAASKLCSSGEKAIGFEDSPRGIKALLASCCRPVWVGPEDYPGKESIVDPSIIHLSSFADCL